METGWWQSGWLVEGAGDPHGNFEMVVGYDYGKPRHLAR